MEIITGTSFVRTPTARVIIRVNEMLKANMKYVSIANAQQKRYRYILLEAVVKYG